MDLLRNGTQPEPARSARLLPQVEVLNFPLCTLQRSLRRTFPAREHFWDASFPRAEPELPEPAEVGCQQVTQERSARSERGRLPAAHTQLRRRRGRSDSSHRSKHAVFDSEWRNLRLRGFVFAWQLNPRQLEALLPSASHGAK